METNYKYYAFISYKHERKGLFKEDAAWAAALDKQLRSLSIPTQISSNVLLNESDKSVDPIYRDSSNLPMTIGGKLAGVLEKNLKASKTLVLILSKAMIENQNAAYNSNPNKSQAWIYWEIKTFLRHHNNDWSRIIPVYIDGDDYDANSVRSRIGIESHYDNIQKPWHDYKTDFNWDTDRELYYMRVACDVASAIFCLEDKSIFWNIKEKAQQAIKAEQVRNKAQRKLQRVIIGIVFLIALITIGLFLSSQARNLVEKAKDAISKGNRLEAQQLVQTARKTWPCTKGTAEVMWEAGDSTLAIFGIDSPITFDERDSLFAFVDKNRFVVIKDAHSFQEIERVDARKAFKAQLSPDANKLIVYQDNSFLDTAFSIYDRKLKEWGDSNRFDKNGVDPLFSKESSFFCTGRQIMKSDGRWFTVLDDNDYSLRASKASFIGTDSIYVAIQHLNGDETIKAFIYNFADEEMYPKRTNWCEPSMVFHFPKGTKEAVISPNSNVIVSYTDSSISEWIIEYNERNYSVKEKHHENTDTPIQSIRYSGSPNSVLVVTSDGRAHSYLQSSGISPRLYPDYSLNNTTKDEAKQAIPIGISPQNSYSILYHFPGKIQNNIADLHYVNYTLPISRIGDVVSCSIHGDIICIVMKDISDGSVQSYLYTKGDNRVITPNGILEVLSSEYYVDYRMDLLHEQTSDWSSTTYSGPCLINARTGEHIMHLARLEDKKPENVHYNRSYLNGDRLVSVFHLKDGRDCIRFYDIRIQSLTKETVLDDYGLFYGWMEDDYFIYKVKDTLYREKADCENKPELICPNFAYGYGHSNSYIFPFQTNDNKYYWYSSIDGQIRPLIHEGGNGRLSPDGAYYLVNDWDHHPDRFEIIDAKSLDTLFTRPINGWAGVEAFDRSYSKFFYSEDRSHICCMDIPSGRENWILDIWAPESIVAGNKYVVLQSTSLYVINISSGKIVCEFDTDPATETRLLLSPNEKWLLAGDKLYSLESKELIASSLADDYVSIENDYIVYPKRIMKLPNDRMMFN